MSKLLMKYLRLAVNETQQARVPNQLVSDDPPEEQGIEEFSGAGGVVGCMAPATDQQAADEKRKNG
jgi:hypothetical protein